MRNLMLLLARCNGGYKAWQHFSSTPHGSNAPLQAEPYLAVYDRDSCGHTQATLRELRQAGIRYQYHSVDEPAVADLNNRITVHPENGELVAQALQSLR